MKQLTDRELAGFCEQFAMILKSGIMIHSGMQMIADDTANPDRKAVFQKISDALTDNGSLAQALKASGAFPEYMVHMIQIGTESGKLDTVMSGLSTYYNKQHTMRENLKSAILYPSVLVVMMLLVLIFLAAKVLPVFQGVYQSLGSEMSPWAQSIMKVGALLSQYSFLLILLLLIAAITALFMTKTERGKAMLSDFIGGRKASQGFSIASFTSSMAMMISSGLDIQHSMQLSMGVIGNRSIKEKVAHSYELLEKNDSFIEALEQSGLFSNATIGILSMGKNSGSLDSAMQYVADIYDEEYQWELAKKVSLIEPVSIAILSVLIGTVLVSVMFPLLGILSSIG
jgi:type IV pilus assembly protein PilC